MSKEARMASGVSRVVSSIMARLMPSMPMWKLEPMAGNHVSIVSY